MVMRVWTRARGVRVRVRVRASVGSQESRVWSITNSVCFFYIFARDCCAALQRSDTRGAVGEPLPERLGSTTGRPGRGGRP